MNSGKTPLLFRPQPIGDLLGDEGGVVAGAVVDNEVPLSFVFYSLVHDLNSMLDYFGTLHARDHIFKREGFGIGLPIIAHPTPLTLANCFLDGGSEVLHLTQNRIAIPFPCFFGAGR
jgi:hypothetical protein